MKKYLLILSFILCGFRGFSQSTPPNMPEFDEKRIHFGVAFGYSSLYSNMVSATSLPLYDTIMGFYSESAPGFTIGVTADLKLLPFLLGFPWWSNGDDSTLPIQGTQVQSLVGKLRSCMLHRGPNNFLNF